jgi:hypothetical protein
MKKYIKIKLIGLALIGVIIAGCGKTASVDPAPVVSPDGYPVATFTTDFAGTDVTEGDTILYTITLDKTIDRSITFHATQTDGDAELHADYEATDGVLAPYTLETEVMVVITDDGDPEDAETLSFEVGATSIADRYLVHPDVVNPTQALNVANLNDPTLLTIKFEWDTDSDIDILTSPGYLATDTVDYWGTGGATGANPEFDYSIWLADPVGTYWVYILNWGDPTPFNYTFTLGLPDGTNQSFDGSFDYATAADDYERDIMGISSWGYPECYRAIEIVVDGSDAFGITVL